MSRTALYRHFDASGRLLYVGVSLSAVQRLAQHASGSHWHKDIARVDVQWHPARERAEQAEAVAIAREDPLHNVARPRVELAPMAEFPAWADNQVRCRGEALAPVIWQGRTWAVTELGIERRDGTYYIQAGRIYQDEPAYSWLKHMEEKGPWSDLHDFAEAFKVARALWPKVLERRRAA